MRIGFSTGALALSDVTRGLAMNRQAGMNAVELSALRQCEVADMLALLDQLPLDDLEYISFHAPSKLQGVSDHDLIQQLQPIIARGWPIIVHPDIISNVDAWASLGRQVLLENMDQRKPIGRNTKELRRLFSALPDARLCFDIAHARQVDPTMSVAVEILTEFADRLAELHISEVDSASRHVMISQMAMKSYQRISSLIPHDIPVIIESMLDDFDVASELEMVRRCLRRSVVVPA